jgi:hypothetical protein
MMKVHRIVAAVVLVAGLAWAQGSASACPPTAPAPAPGGCPPAAPQVVIPPCYVQPPPPSLQELAQFFGSDDYFEAHGGSPRDLVIALYGDVLGRRPAENEIQRWESRLSACGNGVTMAREFLIFAQSELAACAPATPTPALVAPIWRAPAPAPTWSPVTTPGAVPFSGPY